MKTVDLMLETMELLGRLQSEAASAEEKERLSLGFDALNYILALGQPYDFEDYRKNGVAHGPPLVIASFNTQDEANAWLRAHPEPPHHANVLIAGRYFLTAYDRERNHRAILQSSTLEHYLNEITQEGPSSPVAAFHTLEEANTWLKERPTPPQQVFITIAGDDYLAVYHYKIHLRALYRLPMKVGSAG